MNDIPIFPKRIDIELTNYCNYRCTICPRNNMNRNIGFMKFDLYKKIIDETGEYGLEVSYQHLFGESLIHKDFFKMIEYASRNGNIKKIGISTNASYISEENIDLILESKLNEIIISVDCSDEEEYSKIKPGADFDRVIKNINLLIERLKSNFINDKKILIQMIDTDNSRTKVEGFKKFWGDKLTEFTEIKIKKYIHWCEQAKYSDKIYFEPFKGPCRNINNNMAILWDGRAVACCFDVNGKLITGDLNISKIKEVWLGDEMSDLREKHIKQSDSLPEICKRCVNK